MTDAEFLADIRSTTGMNVYRGWSITQGRWPEPLWMATGPTYDASYEGEEDGWVDNGEKADAETFAALTAQIDEWYEENE